MRRLSLAIALLLVILAGSLGGFCPAAGPGVAGACCRTEAPGCPDDCRAPGGGAGPSAPCHMDSAPLGHALSAAFQAAPFHARPGRVEPSPAPAALRRDSGPGSGPGRAGAGPARPYCRSGSWIPWPGTDPQALLSVYRI